MAETTVQKPATPADAAAAKEDKAGEAERVAGGGAAGKVIAGVNPELERQAAAQLEADKEAAKALQDDLAARRKAGRPSSADLAAREAALAEAERRYASELAAGRKAIEARKAKGETAEGDPRRAGQSEVTPETGAAWVRYVGNPRTDGDGPEFETMRGYTFEKDGDWVAVKGDSKAIQKFVGNDHFVVEVVSEDDAADLVDGDVRSFERSAPRRKVGKAA